AVEQVPELVKAGVTSLKIEGRLKKGDWVASAVKLYKSATNQVATEQLKENAEELGQYAGRKQSDAFLKGEHTKMTGQSGRTASDEPNDEQVAEKPVEEPKVKAVDGITIKIDTSQPKTEMTATWGEYEHRWQVTKSKANKKRAMTLSQVAEVLMDTPVYDTKVIAVDIPNDDLLFPNRFIGKVVDELYTFIRINQKVEKKVTITLPAEAKELSLKPEGDAANKHPLGGKPTVLRIDAAQINNFDGLTRYHYIIENAVLETVELAEKMFTPSQVTIALPTVFYSNQIEELTTVIKEATKRKIAIEVNSWGGLHLAKELNAQFLAGPGLAITNGRAGDFLKGLGCQKVYWSIEADRKILTDLSQSTPLPARMTVAGFPVLMHSRVEFPEKAYGKIYQDRREIKMKMAMNQGITTLRTEKPYSLLKQKDANITAAEYVIDLTGLSKPRKTLKQFLSCSIEAPSLFNFDKSLF
ncbi:MAG: U32 family peptidase, partial [Lentisphaeria bacterium]|nr:U32 family peptidase [Lentisphaeria bacterium]